MATIEIDTIQKLIDFSEGEYGRGTSSEYLDVKLIADLDFADYSEQQYSWAGCTGTWYVNFDGQEHTINNIYYMDTAAWGFFYQLYGSVKNLKLTNLYVTVGSNKDACGICVENFGAVIKNCHVSGHIESIQQRAFGISGTNKNSTNIIRECSFSGVLKGSTAVMGIADSNVNSSQNIYNCNVYATLECTSNSTLCFPWGSQRVNIVNCAFIGVVKCTNGLRWHANYNSYVYNSYVVIKEGTTGNTPSIGNLTNCYYDSDVAAAAGITVSAGTAATTAELQDADWCYNHGLPT